MSAHKDSVERENFILRNKVRSLQEEICERTRNFLVQSGRKKAILKSSKEVQCESENVIYDPQMQFDTMERRKEQLYSAEKGQSMYRRKKLLTPGSSAIAITPNKGDEERERQRFLDESDCASELKTNALMRSTAFKMSQFQEDFGTNLEESSVLSRAQSTQVPTQNKLQRKVERLTRKFTQLTQTHRLTREGLMRAEQQNYRFRLEIKRLKKIINSKQGTDGSHCEEANDYAELNNEGVFEGGEFLLLQEKQWDIEILMKKICQIAKEIPDQGSVEIMFTPRSQPQAMVCLERIAKFTREVGEWEKKVIEDSSKSQLKLFRELNQLRSQLPTEFQKTDTAKCGQGGSNVYQ